MTDVRKRGDMTAPLQLADHYFALAAGTDRDAYLDQFAADAEAVDEGHTYRGLDEIRSWRDTVTPVRYAVREVSSTGPEQASVVVAVSGDFPGSPVTLIFHFGFAGDHIRTLTIALSPIGEDD
jgi:hypothetical protein